MTDNQSATNELDQIFLSIVNDLFSNVIQTSEEAANEILKISSEISSEAAQSAVQSFQALYQSDANTNEIKYNFNLEVDEILNTAQQTDQQATFSAEDSQLHDAGHQLAEVQKLLEATINSNKELRNELAPIVIGMQFAETTSQHLTHLISAWQCIIDDVATNTQTPVAELLDKIEQELVSPIEVTAFYQSVRKQPPPSELEGDHFSEWLDALFEGEAA